MKFLVVSVLVAAIGFVSSSSAAPARVSGVGGFLLEKGFTRVPLKRYRNHSQARVILNGQHMDLVVDTGADMTVITPGAMQSLGLKVTEHKGDTYGAMSRVSRSRQAGDVQDFRVGDYQAGVTPVSSIGSFVGGGKNGRTTEGLLGIDFLNKHQGVIDCFRQELYLKAPNAPSASAALSGGLRAGGCKEIQIVPTNQGLLVPITLNGHAGWLVIDTGAPYTLVDEAAVRGHGMSRASTRGLGMSDVGGESRRVDMAYFKELLIGAFSVPPQGIGVADIRQGAAPKMHGGKPVFGYLGQELLGFYAGVIDCRSLKLYLRLDPAIEAERKRSQS